MNFHVLTLFPEMITRGLHTSITGRAMEKGTISLEAVNIRDYTLSKHKKVDDYTYGGGAGMLMQAQPVFDAWKAVTDKIFERNAQNIDDMKAESSGEAQEADKGAVQETSVEHVDKRTRVVYVTPQGITFNQSMAKDFAKEEDLIFLCGHYEGIDERVLEEIVTDYVSIGDYVLTGGELAAMVMIDAISRMVPGVLSNQKSGETESFSNYLLEYPQYSRPEVWHDKKVPEVLLSGDHAKVEEWRLEKSLERTKERRPDLYEKWAAENEEYFIKKAKREERKRRNELRKARKVKAGEKEYV